jgi:tRNA-dihydrouridine synthase
LAAGSQTLILGNGDIKNYQQATEHVAQSGVAGVLIGRAALGNPFVFTEQKVTPRELAQVALEHCELYEKLSASREKYNFLPMRTHLAAYIRDFPEASKVRSELMRTNSAAEVKVILEKYQL